MEFLSKLLKVAANENRIKMLRILLDGKAMEIGDIANRVNLPYKTTARNLKILEKHDFLESNFNSGYVYYSLKKRKQNSFHDKILKMIKRRI
ncbi:MAG: winged helix-turn-helix domain-containing protein [bacterium]